MRLHAQPQQFAINPETKKRIWSRGRERKRLTNRGCPHMSVTGCCFCNSASTAWPVSLQAGPGCDGIAKKWSVAHWVDATAFLTSAAALRVPCGSAVRAGGRAGGRELRVTLISLRRRFTQLRGREDYPALSRRGEGTPARIAINFGIAINLGELSKRNAVCGTGLQRHRPACLKVGYGQKEIA